MESSPYPGYPPNYWYHSPPYNSAYPSGTEVNGQPPYNPQAMSGFPNGVYSTGQYQTNMMHPTNPFYCSEQMPPRQAQYHNQGCPDRSAAVAAAAAAAPPGCPQSAYPVPHCQGAPAYPPGSYPHYGDGCPPNPAYAPQQPMHMRAQPEVWAHSGGYGAPPPPATHHPHPHPHPHPHAHAHPAQQQQQQQWQSGSQPHNGHYPNHVRPAHPPPWQGPAPPPYEHKEPPYPGPPQAHPRNQPPKPQPGTPNQNPNPNPAQSKPAEFSAPPHIYNKTQTTGERAKPVPEPKPGQTEPLSNQRPPTPSTPPSDNRGLARVQQVLARVQLLQEDVDEFVGRKTDKSYRYLEELLTKELLELDSVETNGQDSVRYARKDAVQRIQAILDRLEKKAF